MSVDAGTSIHDQEIPSSTLTPLIPRSSLHQEDSGDSCSLTARERQLSDEGTGEVEHGSISSSCPLDSGNSQDQNQEAWRSSASYQQAVLDRTRRHHEIATTIRDHGSVSMSCPLDSDTSGERNRETLRDLASREQALLKLTGREKPQDTWGVPESREHAQLRLAGRDHAMAANETSSDLRTDIFARNSLRELIQSTMLSESISPVDRMALLEDYKSSAENSGLGIPFRKILSEPMDDLGVPALMYEIMGCEPVWDGVSVGLNGSGLELVQFLIENWHENPLVHGNTGVCMSVVRTACLRRSIDDDEGNKLFQVLRPLVAQTQNQLVLNYDISITRLNGVHPTTSEWDSQQPDLSFTTLINIPRFTSNLLTETIHVPVELIAARRAWRLNVDKNSLELELLDGPDEPSAPLVDARVKVILPEHDASGKGSTSGNAPIELLLPRARLRPITTLGGGSSGVKLSPCFCSVPGDDDAIRGLDDERLLHDWRGALLLELIVHVEHEPSDFALINVRNVPPKPTTPTPETATQDVGPVQSGIDEDDDLYVTSEVDENTRRNGRELGGRGEESEWEELSQADETELREGGWVKASWSGRDEDL